MESGWIWTASGGQSPKLVGLGGKGEGSGGLVGRWVDGCLQFHERPFLLSICFKAGAGGYQKKLFGLPLSL